MEPEIIFSGIFFGETDFFIYICTVKTLFSLHGWNLLTNLSNFNMKNKMKKYICDVCAYEYDPAVGDPENGIPAGTAFEDLPEDWVCPLCGVGKDEFSPAE